MIKVIVLRRYAPTNITPRTYGEDQNNTLVPEINKIKELISSPCHSRAHLHICSCSKRWILVFVPAVSPPGLLEWLYSFKMPMSQLFKLPVVLSGMSCGEVYFLHSLVESAIYSSVSLSPESPSLLCKRTVSFEMRQLPSWWVR